MNDSDIVRLFLERDQKALSIVSDKYKSYCAKIAVNILGSYEDAEECVNDALLQAWESIPPQKPAMLSAYLGKLTRNLAINKRRRTLAQKRGSGNAESVFEELSELVSGGESAEHELNKNELIREIGEFLYTLPEQKRNIFICRYWYCDSISDIAEEFAVSTNKVYVTLNRTRKKLREYLQKRGYEL